jgi:hypothetical protein
MRVEHKAVGFERKNGVDRIHNTSGCVSRRLRERSGREGRSMAALALVRHVDEPQCDLQISASRTNGGGVGVEFN